MQPLLYSFYYYIEDKNPLKNFSDILDIDYWLHLDNDVLIFSDTYYTEEAKKVIKVPLNGILKHYAETNLKTMSNGMFHFTYGEEAYRSFLDLIHDVIQGEFKGIEDIIMLSNKNSKGVFVQEAKTWLATLFAYYPEQCFSILQKIEPKEWSDALLSTALLSDDYKRYLPLVHDITIKKKHVSLQRYYDILQHREELITLSIDDYCQYLLGYKNIFFSNKDNIIQKLAQSNVSPEELSHLIEHHILVTDIKTAADVAQWLEWYKICPTVIETIMEKLSSYNILKHHLLIEQRCGSESELWNNWCALVPGLKDIIQNIYTTETLLQCSLREALNHEWQNIHARESNSEVPILI